MRGTAWRIRYEGEGPEYDMKMGKLRYERGGDNLIRTG